MKKNIYSIVVCSLLLIANISFAQKPQQVVVLDYDNVLSVSSSYGDKASNSANPDKTGINPSDRAGKFIHGSGDIWSNEEQQIGRNNPDVQVDLRYYTSYEFKAYLPSASNIGQIRVELNSDGPDNANPGDPNVQRENWERIALDWFNIPEDNDGNDLRDQWFKLEKKGIVSGRELGMLKFAYRWGADAGSATQEIMYFDDFIFHLTETPEICLYRETFFLDFAANQSFDDNPNKDAGWMLDQPWGVVAEKGAARWVGGIEPQTSNISLVWENDRDHFLELGASSPEILLEGIDIENFTNIKLAFDVSSKAPSVKYQIDNGEWQTVNIGTVTTAWSTKTFDISTTGGEKINIKLSGEGISSGFGYLDNLTVWGTDNSLSSIKKINVSNIKLYPNPVTDLLKTSGGDVEKIELYDVQGKLVATKISSEINIAHLAQGAYIVKLFTPNGIYSSKVFKK